MSPAHGKQERRHASAQSLHCCWTMLNPANLGLRESHFENLYLCTLRLNKTKKIRPWDKMCSTNTNSPQKLRRSHPPTYLPWDLLFAANTVAIFQCLHWNVSESKQTEFKAKSYWVSFGRKGHQLFLGLKVEYSKNKWPKLFYFGGHPLDWTLIRKGINGSMENGMYVP